MGSMTHRSKTWILALPFVPLVLMQQSCCTLFGLFGCGTGIPITKISWDSPEETVRTMLTALRASDTKVLYEALSEDFKRANGLDGMSFSVGWERMRSQIPGLHLAGDAEIIERGKALDAAGRALPGREVFRLRAHGYTFLVEVARYAYWDLGARDPESGEARVLGAYLDELGDRVVISDTKGVVDTRIKSPDLIGLTLDDLHYVKIGWAWKVGRFTRADE